MQNKNTINNSDTKGPLILRNLKMKYHPFRYDNIMNIFIIEPPLITI